MSVELTTAGLTWAPHASPEAAEKLLRVLRAWEGTPYAVGQKCRGVAADCIRAGHGVVEDWSGQKLPETPRLPPDTALHNRRGAIAQMREMRACFPPHRVRRDGIATAGSIVVTGHVHGGPGHMLLVGPERNTLWQAGTIGFGRHGWGLQLGWQHLWRVFEFIGSEQWR